MPHVVCALSFGVKRPLMMRYDMIREQVFSFTIRSVHRNPSGWPGLVWLVDHSITRYSVHCNISVH